jgi:hypothetical protein
MKKYIILLLILPIFLFPQKEGVIIHKKASIYLEFSGNGILIPSLNTEYLFGKKRNFGVRLGYGYEFVPNPVFQPNQSYHPAPDYTIPAEIIYLIGENNLRVELGVGLTTAYYSQLEYNKRFFYVFRLGSRYTFNNGLLFRVAITPALEPTLTSFYDLIVPLGGISIGYSF